MTASGGGRRLGVGGLSEKEKDSWTRATGQ